MLFTQKLPCGSHHSALSVGSIFGLLLFVIAFSCVVLGFNCFVFVFIFVLVLVLFYLWFAFSFDFGLFLFYYVLFSVAFDLLLVCFNFALTLFYILKRVVSFFTCSYFYNVFYVVNEYLSVSYVSCIQDLLRGFDNM